MAEKTYKRNFLSEYNLFPAGFIFVLIFIPSLNNRFVCHAVEITNVDFLCIKANKRIDKQFLACLCRECDVPFFPKHMY